MTKHITSKHVPSELVCKSVPSTSSGQADRPEPLKCGSARPSHRTSATAFTAAPPDEDDPLQGFAPYLHKQPRRNSITPNKQRAFIATLAATGIVTQAARSIGVSLEALYKLRRLPGAEGFAAAWEAALDHGVARLEDCALALALEGEELPIVSAGKLLGTFRKHNFGFIRFMLAQRRPARFGEREALAALRPGHPVYERLRKEWECDAFGSEDETLREIDAMLDQMRANAAANMLLLAEDEDAVRTPS